jgi:hypothetical protein
LDRCSPSTDKAGRYDGRSFGAVMDAREFFQKVVVPRYTKLVLLRRRRPMPRPLLCPICKSAVQGLDRTGDATGYTCPTHGNFKVVDTVFAEAKAKDCAREQWEAALDKAEERAEPDSWPLILVDDFY